MLDIDSVVNSETWYVKTKGRSGDFDPEAIALLNQLEPYGVEVVISSSWGEDADKPLMDLGLELPIVGHTRHFYSEHWLCRGNEIAKWLYENIISMTYEDNYEYVIFDDDKDFLMSQEENFVWIDRMHGVTQSDIDKAREILTGNGRT